MFNPSDINTKFYYKLTTKGQYEEVVKLFNSFKLKNANTFIDLPSGGCCFLDFTVKVTLRFGDIIFEKGSTEESSSSCALISNEQSRNELSQEPPHSGELIFEKGNTDESSSGIHPLISHSQSRSMSEERKQTETETILGKRKNLVQIADMEKPERKRELKKEKFVTVKKVDSILQDTWEFIELRPEVSGKKKSWYRCKKCSCEKRTDKRNTHSC